jgi:hypothetical protein
MPPKKGTASRGKQKAFVTEEFNFCCLVLGEDTTLLVAIHKDAPINELRAKIFETRSQTSFSKIPVENLSLYKVCHV